MQYIIIRYLIRYFYNDVKHGLVIIFRCSLSSNHAYERKQPINLDFSIQLATHFSETKTTEFIQRLVHKHVERVFVF